MAGVVEVHDRMVAQLHQRNLQLQQEKAETELRLRQATALLTELQAAWLDLPPKVAASIEKLLVAGQSQSAVAMSGAHGGQGMGTPNMCGSPGTASLATSVASAAPKPEKKTVMTWLSFNLEEMFGCTALRNADIETEPAATSGPAPTEAPPRDVADPGLAQVGSQVPAWPRLLSLSGPKPQHSRPASKEKGFESLPQFDSPGIVGTLPLTLRSQLASDSIRELVPGRFESAVGNCVFEESAVDMPAAEWGGNSYAMDVSDLLCEAPGAISLVAEIDAMCCGLRRDSECAREDMTRRLEEVREDGRQLRQELEDTYLRSSCAKDAELELCKAQLAELTATLNPQFSLEQELAMELCDAEWARCQRASEMRAKAGQAHAEWLEECLSQRARRAEELLAARQRDFAQELEAIWDRKAKLTARLRRASTSTTAEAVEVPNQNGPLGNPETVSLRKAVHDFETSALEPLKALAAAQQGPGLLSEVRRLQAAITEGRSQCKAATGHLSGLALQCQSELKARVSGANAALFGQARLRRRSSLAVTFNAWVAARLALALVRSERALEGAREDKASIEARFETCGTACMGLERRLTRALSGCEWLGSRSDAVANRWSSRREARTWCLTLFIAWARLSLRAEAERLKQELVQNQEDVAHVHEGLDTQGKQRSNGEEVQWLQRVLDLEARMRTRQKASSPSLLIFSFNAWAAKRLEALLLARKDEVETQRGLSADLGRRLDCVEAALATATARGMCRLLLILAFRSWTEAWLRQVALDGEEEVDARMTQSDIQLSELREQVVSLIDGMKTPQPVRSPGQERRRRMSSGSGAASSVRSEAVTPFSERKRRGTWGSPAGSQEAFSEWQPGGSSGCHAGSHYQEAFLERLPRRSFGSHAGSPSQYM